MNNPISILFNSSLKFKYFFAFSDWAFNGSIFVSISDKISFILSKFNFVCSNFFSLSAFLVLYFTIPAASSKICLLSSDLLLNISSIFPCPIIEYPSFPMPVYIQLVKHHLNYRKLMNFLQILMIFYFVYLQILYLEI